MSKTLVRSLNAATGDNYRPFACAERLISRNDTNSSEIVPEDVGSFSLRQDLRGAFGRHAGISASMPPEQVNMPMRLPPPARIEAVLPKRTLARQPMPPCGSYGAFACFSLHSTSLQLGRCLIEPLKTLAAWAQRNRKAIEAARVEFDMVSLYSTFGGIVA
jgi:hypothetical protein